MNEHEIWEHWIERKKYPRPGPQRNLSEFLEVEETADQRTIETACRLALAFAVVVFLWMISFWAVGFFFGNRAL